MSESKHSHAFMFRRGPNAATGSRRREETTIRIRKQKRAERLNKRRQRTFDADLAAVVAPSDMTALQALARTLESGPLAQQYIAAQKVRKLLSKDDPPIHAVIRAGMVPSFVRHLGCADNPRLQFEATWVLTNLASDQTDSAQVVVDAGGMEALVPLLDSPDDDVREQSTWALGNLSGDCIAFRDRALYLGMVPALLRNFRPQQQRATLTQTMAWCMSNLCRGKPAPRFHVVEPLLGALSWLIQKDDEEALADTCWALSYITEGGDECAQAVVDTGAAMRLVRLMEHPSPMIQTPAVRAVGNILTGADQPTQVVIDAGALPILHRLLGHKKRAIKKEACWGLSNIAAGSRRQLQRLIDQGVLPKVVELLASAEFAVKREAAWVIGNATALKDDAQIHQIVRAGAIHPMVDIMHSHDVKLIRVVLETLENVLEVGERAQMARGLAVNLYAELVESSGAVEHLEGLQDHEDESIYQQAVNILERYFQDDGGAEPAPVPAPVGFDFSTGFS